MADPAFERRIDNRSVRSTHGGKAGGDDELRWKFHSEGRSIVEQASFIKVTLGSGHRVPRVVPRKRKSRSARARTDGSAECSAHSVGNARRARPRRICYIDGATLIRKCARGRRPLLLRRRAGCIVRGEHREGGERAHGGARVASSSSSLSRARSRPFDRRALGGSER